MSVKKALAKGLAREIADKALVGVPSKEDGLVWDPAAEEVADKVVRQSPLLKSKRFYSLIASVAAVGAGWIGLDMQASDFEELLPLIGTMAGAALVAWDKFSDIREERK